MADDLGDSLTAFEALYVRSRFGQSDAADIALQLGKALLAQSSIGEADRARTAVKLGVMSLQTDPAASRAFIDLARSLGADIPLLVARPDETGAPPADQDPTEDNPDVSWHEVVGGCPNPDLTAAMGDGWHPSFDLVTTDAPALRVAVIKNGYLSVDTTKGRVQTYVYDAARRLVRSLSSGPTPFLEPTFHLNGPAVLVDDVFTQFNVCHALYDKFPRLAAYEQILPNTCLTAILFQDHSYYRQALGRFGHAMFMPPESGRWTVQATDLCLLSNHRRGEVLHPGYRGANVAVKFLSKHTQAKNRGHRRIFISRSDAQIERLANARDVESCFKKQGFDIVAIGNRSFSEQAELFGAASHIAGVHGAGMANLAFAARGTEVFEIMHPIACSSANWVMSQSLGQRYTVFLADDAEYTMAPGAQYDATLTNRPILVDVERLAKMLQAVYA